jgi:peptidyl-prolyl cis-trans isomerase B (cyclophilin B)
MKRASWLASVAFAVLAASAARAGSLEVEWRAPSVHVPGRPFLVEVEIRAAEEGAVVAGWMLTQGAFTIDGQAVAERRESEPMPLPTGFTIEGSIDLAPFIQGKSEFKLAYASELLGDDPFVVRVLAPAPAGKDFLTCPVAELDDYNVLLVTSRGDLLLEFWPEIAPNHVRNFLALSAEGFYDGTTFHRVIPGFMIQGGDPTGTGTGSGPRQLKAEFSTDPRYSHKPGVLSMARSQNPDSASCQFFVMHGTSKQLDGQYSAFGKLVSGAEVVDAIVNTPRNQMDKPSQPQTIERAVVVLAPAAQGE